MPTDKSNIGMGRQRQGSTGASGEDIRNRSLDRSIGHEADSDVEYEKGKQAGAHDPDGTPSRSRPANLKKRNTEA